MKLKQIKQKGFTMIELVIVIAVLGILAAFALPRFADFSTQAKINTTDNIVAAFNVSFALAKTKYIANGSTGTSVDMDGDPLTTDDIIPMNTYGNVNITNILGVANCTKFINALVPNQNNVSINSPRRGVCEIENNNYKLTLRNGGLEPAIDVINK